METRADQLVRSLAYALRGVKAKGRDGTLSEDDRYAIVRVVVEKLRERGDPCGMDVEFPPFFHGRPTQG